MKKPLGQYGPAGVADTTSTSTPASALKDDDDDDIDLFGSDEEVRSMTLLSAVMSQPVLIQLVNMLLSCRKMQRQPG